MIQTILVDDAGRLQLIDMTIRMLQESGDPRAPGAIAEYERQRAVVAARMGSASSPTGGNCRCVAEVAEGSGQGANGKPPAQIVGMQTLALGTAAQAF